MQGSLFASEKTHQKYYRYADENGAIVISSTLPPGYNNRYEIITTSGAVVEKVEPKRSFEEVKKEVVQTDLLNPQTEEEKQNINQSKTFMSDEVLWKSFANENDIVKVRDEKLAAIKVMEDISTSNLKTLEEQLHHLEEIAAEAERSGNKIPNDILQSIQDTTRQISNNRDYLAKKKDEREAILKQYTILLKRYQGLKTLQEEIKTRMLQKQP